MLYREAVEVMWKKRGNTTKAKEIHAAVKNKICGAYEAFHKGSKSIITPRKIDSWRATADHWWELSLAFEDDNLFYGFLLALPPNQSNTFVRATHDLLRIVPYVVRTFFDKVMVFSKGLQPYGRHVSMTASIPDDSKILGLEVIDPKWITQSTPASRLVETADMKPAKVYEHLAVHGKVSLQDGLGMLSHDMAFGGVSRLSAEINVELHQLENDIQQRQARHTKLEANRARLQTLSPTPGPSLAIDSLGPRITPVEPKAERINVRFITH
jgi:hypothetical protein